MLRISMGGVRINLWFGIVLSKSMKENLYIDLDEDIQSVIQKIQESEADDLALIVPTGARILQNIVDAHLIREAGEENSKALTVVTSDLMGKIFAERAGLTVSGSTNLSSEDRLSGPARATQASVLTGRISDIIPRRRGIPVSAVKKQSAGPKRVVSTSLTVSKGGSKKASDFRLGTKNKGEIGTSFLKSYRAERSRVSVFNELAKINKRKFSWPFRLSPTSFVMGVVAVTVAVSFVVFGQTLPKAEVAIYPVREPKNEVVGVLISSEYPKVNLDKGLIPGEILTLEKTESGEFAATGSRDASGKAKGKITIYNAYSAQVQKFVPSRFQSEGDPSTGVGAGQIFWTVKSITVPGYTTLGGKIVPGQMVTEVIAAEAGEAYNIGPGKFTMPALKGTPKAEKIYAISDSPLTGGGTGEYKMVSNDDATKAYTELKEKIKPQLAEFRQNLPQGFQLWPEAYNEELADSKTNPEIGAAAEKFTATVKMVARAVVFKNDDLDAYINKRISSNLEEGQALLTSSKEVSFLKPPVIDYKKGTILTTLNVKYDVMGKFDEAAFKNSITNKKQKDIDISLYKVERIEVNLWPFWVRSVPSNTDRVSVRIVGL